MSSVFKRLRLTTKFKGGKDVLPVIPHSRVIAHTKHLPIKSHSSTDHARRETDIGNPEPYRSASIASPDAVSLESSRATSPTPVVTPDITDPMLQYEQEEQEAYASMSKMSRKLPTSPVVSLDPNVAISLPNGDLYYKVTTRVNLAEKFIGSSIAMAVELALKDEPMDVSSLLSRLIVPEPNAASQPQLTAYTIFSLVDPLKVCLSNLFVLKLGPSNDDKGSTGRFLMTCKPILLLILNTMLPPTL